MSQSQHSPPRVQGFDRLAAVYDLMMCLVFAGEIKRSQRHFLDTIPNGARVLIIGGGTGAWLKGHLGRLGIDYVEYSPKMMDRFRQKIPPLDDSTNLITADALTYAYTGQYDAILTPFFLDLFGREQMSDWVLKMSDHLKTDGVWIMTDYTPFGKCRRLKVTLINLMYWICHWFCPLDNLKYWPYERVFDKDWRLQTHKTFALGLITSFVFNKKSQDQSEAN